MFRRLFQVPFRDPETGFKFFLREKIVPVAKRTQDAAWFWDSEIMVLAHQAGLHIVEVPCRFERRRQNPRDGQFQHFGRPGAGAGW